ncbi:hypothetical protein [Micromonospora sp. CPCC 205556]|uniref:hypothetical protein n=1 Tax=Micromonospora sp. CPCC 205556 TaxID=3122398 RepID=UPI002FF2DE9E
MWRRLGATVLAVPVALRTMASRRFGYGLLALPVAAAAVGLTAALAYLVLINVLVYPFRPYLGLHGNDGGDVWASTYHGSWGGPTLAGAWAVHGIGVMLLLFPPAAWAVRGLLRVHGRLIGLAVAPVRPATRAAFSMSIPGSFATSLCRWPGWYRVGVVGLAIALFFGLARIAHAVGIGDNVLWLPRDPRSGLALAAVLAPFAIAALTVRSWWSLGTRR